MSNCTNVSEVCLKELCSAFVEEKAINPQSSSNTLELNKIGFIFIILSALVVGSVLTAIISNRHYAKHRVQATTKYIRSTTLKSQHKNINIPEISIDEIGRPLSDTRYEGEEKPVNLKLEETAGQSGRLQKLVGNFKSSDTDYCIQNDEDLSSHGGGSEKQAKKYFLQRFKSKFRSNRSTNQGRRSTNMIQRKRGSSKLSAVAINPTIVRKPKSKRKRESEEDKGLESNL